MAVSKGVQMGSAMDSKRCAMCQDHCDEFELESDEKSANIPLTTGNSTFDTSRSTQDDVTKICGPYLCDKCASSERLTTEDGAQELGSRLIVRSLRRCERKREEIAQYLRTIGETEEKLTTTTNQMKGSILRAGQEIISQIKHRMQYLVDEVDVKRDLINQKIERLRSESNELRNNVSVAAEQLRVCDGDGSFNTQSEDICKGLSRDIERHLETKLDTTRIEMISQYVQELQFLPSKCNDAANVGLIVEPSPLWEISQEVPIPEHSQQAGVAMLPSGEIVMGSAQPRGGVDVYSLDGIGRKVIRDVTAHDIATLSDGQIVVLTDEWKLYLYDANGRRRDVDFSTPSCDQWNNAYLATDRHDNIYASFPRLDKIFVYQQTGGCPILTIQPDAMGQRVYHLNVTRAGQLVANVNGVFRVLDRSGAIVSTIPSRDGYCWRRPAIDHLGNIYVVRKDHQTSLLHVDQYNLQGDYIDTLLKDICIKDWPRNLLAPSPGMILLFTKRMIYVIRSKVISLDEI